MELTEASNYLGAAGLVWDIAGAWLLSRGMWIEDKSVMKLSSSGWGFSTSLLRSYCEQRLDTKLGLQLLILGFLIQAVSSAGISVDITCAIWVALLVLVPLGWFYAHYKVWVLRDTFCALETRSVRDVQEATVRETFSDYPDRIWNMATINSGYQFAEPVQ
jgi:hypothetical protein